MALGSFRLSRIAPWLGTVLWLAALTACAPRRPADFTGVVKTLGQAAYGWEAMLEADARETRYPTVEPMRVYLGQHPRGLRVGCRVRAWFSNGLVMDSYPGQAFAEALRIDGCPARYPAPSRPAA